MGGDFIHDMPADFDKSPIQNKGNIRSLGEKEKLKAEIKRDVSTQQHDKSISRCSKSPTAQIPHKLIVNLLH